MKKVKKIVLYAVIVIAVIGCGVVAKNKLASSHKNTTATAAEPVKTAVDVQQVKATQKKTGDTYKATLEAYQQGVISSKISAKVLTVSIENGQYVNQGDVIAKLDDQDIQNSIKTAQSQIQVNEQQVNAAEQQLNAAQVSMEKLKINVDDAKRNYDRQKTLFDNKAISQSELEAAEKAVNTTQADYDSGNASIENSKASIQTSKASLEAQKVALANYQDNLKNTVITAPISGIISDKSLNVGQMASQGSVLAKINDISSVYATIQVPQEKINSVKIGQTATITVDGSDKTYDGTMKNMDLSADATSRVFNCKVQIENSDKSLHPGVYGQVQLLSEEGTSVITVPISALVGTEGDYSVFINDNGTAKKQKVTIGETDQNNVEITDGIQEGDQVICTNTSSLQDGQEIDVVSVQDSDSNQSDSTTQDSNAAQQTDSTQDGDTKEAVSE
ncbi:efflux RND transporter periplasmic adaptor subunit [Clostridium saccharobutylicum]|uniref:Macrolide export protein MacA n=1 Tax=Clostridium saccharobutylicum TaxID=169679 RepID=A0A1S8NI72_CLOSA|nr:efflux RND transporter periplasmic adaptor subunit [Clostridium saccharobutylicum]OOM16062.1 macrolide export protein MacA [Clostridium saccharobutylicum]